jgi:hypothetical protein
MGRLFIAVALAGLIALTPLILRPLVPALTAEEQAEHQTFQEFARRNGELWDRICAASSKEEADTLRQAQQQLLKEWKEAYRKGFAR